jgi:hypothetical protein
VNDINPDDIADAVLIEDDEPPTCPDCGQRQHRCRGAISGVCERGAA